LIFFEADEAGLAEDEAGLAECDLDLGAIELVVGSRKVKLVYKLKQSYAPFDLR
jgi:hypothetical protein